MKAAGRTHPPPAVILCGGRASRLGGGDKPLLAIGDKIILDMILTRLAPQVGDLALSVNGDPSMFSRFALPILVDATGDRPGPLAGILAAMRWASARGRETVLTVAGDTPFLPLDLAARLADAAQPGRPAAASSAGRLHPIFALWPTALAPAAEEMLANGRRRVADLLAERDSVTVDFRAPLSVDPFFNVNTPDDLAKARAIAAGLAR